MDGIQLNKQIQAYVSALKDSLTQDQKDMFNSLTLEVETLKQQGNIAASKKDLEPISKRLNEIAEQATQMMADNKANQEVIDRFVADYNKRQSDSNEKKGFKDAWSEMISEMQTKGEKTKDGYEYRDLAKKDGSMAFELKTTMTTSNAISGSGVLDYNPRQGIVPTQRTNMRDIIPTVKTNNGMFVTYRETNSLQAFTQQTEGSAKAEVNYVFTPGTATLQYIAGTATFSKQLLAYLPFMEGSLPRMLVRDFYKKENNYIYTTIAAAATGSNYSTATVDVEEVIDMITNLRDTDFDPTWILTDWTEWGRLLKTKPSDYSLPAGTTVASGGQNLVIAGVPIIGASYAASDKLLVVDRDYVERVEGESLRVEFSYEHDTNFTKNLVTARCECFEEVNLLRTDAVIYRDLGNS